jgi:hypothetical protein
MHAGRLHRRARLEEQQRLELLEIKQTWEKLTLQLVARTVPRPAKAQASNTARPTGFVSGFVFLQLGCLLTCRCFCGFSLVFLY